MIVSHSIQGVRAHCFRDSEHGGYEASKRDFTLEQLRERKEQIASLMASDDGCSSSRLSEIWAKSSGLSETSSTVARLWLTKSAISELLWTEHQFRWNEKLSLCVMPLALNSGKFVARNLGGTYPKYLSSASRSDVFSSLPKLLLEDRGPDTVDGVVVEDILSAIRVGRLVQSASLLGTTVAGKEAEILRVFPQHKDRKTRLGVWMDGDKSGKKGRDVVANRLSLLGYYVFKITTPKDPKYYSNREIRSILIDRSGSPTAVEEPKGLPQALWDSI